MMRRMRWSQNKKRVAIAMSTVALGKGNWGLGGTKGLCHSYNRDFGNSSRGVFGMARRVAALSVGFRARNMS